jgi:hypothetical protein
MSEPDDIDEVLRDLDRFAKRPSEYTPIDETAFNNIPQVETECDFGPEDELIIGDDYVTYLIFAEEHEITDFVISTEDDSIEVKTQDFTLKRELGMRVDPEEPSSTYANGILSVKLKRITDREAVA